MFDNTYFYLMIVVLLFAIGDLIGYISKGKLSGMMMVMLMFLMGFLAKILPDDIIDRAGLTELTSIAAALVLFNMGASINIKQLFREWRTALMAALSMLFSCIAILCVAPLVGMKTALLACPVINGAAMATALMTSAAMERGLTMAAALCAVIYSIQKFIGAPIASAMGMRYGRRLILEFRKDPQKNMALLEEKQKWKTDKILFYEKHKELYTSNVLIAIVCVGAWISHVLGSYTNISYSIWALLLGSISGIGGYIPSKPLQKGNAYGIIMIAVLGSIIPSLAYVSMKDLITMAWQIVILFVAACMGIFIIGYVLPGWKLVGSRELAIGIGVEQFLGFPSNVIICREIGERIGETDEEKMYIEESLSIPYVVAGITVVTVLSVALAGVVIGMI